MGLISRVSSRTYRGEIMHALCRMSIVSTIPKRPVLSVRQSLCSASWTNTSIRAATTTTKRRKMAPQRLSEEERKSELPFLFHKGWKMAEDRDAIEKEYKFKNFNQAFAFMTAVALNSEVKCHHPEWSNVYNTVKVLYATHDACDGDKPNPGITSKDVECAKFADAYTQH